MGSIFREYPDKYLIIGGVIVVTGAKTIDVEPIACRDSNQDIDLVTTTDISIDISTNGINGLDTGAVANSTTYYLYAIRSKKFLNDKAVGFVFSLSNTAPTLTNHASLVGYDRYRQVGVIIVSAGGSIQVTDTVLTIKGIVDTYADLPVTPDDVLDLYIVRTATGIWLINRKPAGLYNWNIGSSKWVHMSAFPEQHNDANFSVYNNADNTKIIKLSGANITTGNTRTITMADVNIDLADIVLNNTHRTSDGKNHSDVVLNNTHRGSNGNDHSNVVLNNTHRGSDGKDHSDVVLNNTHRGSDGKNHSDVVLNTTHRGLTNNPHSTTLAQIGYCKSFAIRASNPYVSTTSQAYSIIADFVFPGSNIVGAVTKACASAWRIAGANTYSLRLYDYTNSTIIAEVTGLSNETKALIDFGTVSNIPATEALFEVQLKADGVGTTVACSSVGIRR